MSHIPDPHSDENLIFYGDEKGDDFTFYVKQDKGRTVVQTLQNIKSKRYRPVGQNEGDEPRAFSFPERVSIKNLTLTKENVHPDDDFWIALRKTSREACYRALAKRFDEQKKQTKPSTDPPAKFRLKILLETLNKIVDSECPDGCVERSDLDDRDRAFLESLDSCPDTDKQKRWHNRLILEKTFAPLITMHEGRGLICSTDKGEYLSITFRKISDSIDYEPPPYAEDNSEARKGNAFSLGEYCDLLYEEIFERTDSTKHAQGLLIITGATNSAKSKIARGLIHKHLELQAKTKRKRKPHLVTYEDPIEGWYLRRSAPDSFAWAAIEPETRDYTPREKEKDADLLANALNDALRQTPALFFVGETRDREEWKVLMNFAGTGHLILTTAHAGSLIEAMHKIFEALEVKTPADRSEVANKLLGIVHLRSSDVEFTPETKRRNRLKESPTNILFPAIWRRTPLGIATLISDGLASLLPYRPDRSQATRAISSATSQDKSDPSSLGRRWLMQQLFETHRDKLEDAFDEKTDDLQAQAFKKAIEWDLGGV